MTKIVSLSIALLAVLSASLSAQVTYKPGEGWEGVKAAEFGTDRGDFEQALAVYQTGDTRTAMTMCDGVINTYKTGIWVERAMLLKARAYFRLNDLKQSTATLDALKKQFPGTSLGAEISDLQLAIANKQIENKKAAGAKALEDMVENNPYGPRSDQAQFEVGQYYMKNKKYQDAIDAFSLVLIHYADSRYREDALFLRSKAAYLDSQGPQRDSVPYEETRQGVLDYQQEPNGKYAKEAGELLAKADNALAQKLYLIGEFYRTQGHERASERYYQAVVIKYPKNIWAKMARAKLPMDWVPPEPKTEAQASPAAEQPLQEQKPETQATPPAEPKAEEKLETK